MCHNLWNSRELDTCMKEDEGMGRVVRWDNVQVRGNDKSLGLSSDDARGIIEEFINVMQVHSFWL